MYIKISLNVQILKSKSTIFNKVTPATLCKMQWITVQNFAYLCLRGSTICVAYKYINLLDIENKKQQELNNTLNGHTHTKWRYSYVMRSGVETH